MFLAYSLLHASHRNETDRFVVVAIASTKRSREAIRFLDESNLRCDWSKYKGDVTIFGIGNKARKMRTALRRRFGYPSWIKYSNLSPLSENIGYIPCDILIDVRARAITGPPIPVADFPDQHIPPVMHYLYRSGIRPGLESDFGTTVIFAADKSDATKIQRALQARYGNKTWLHYSEPTLKRQDAVLLARYVGRKSNRVLEAI